MKSQELPANNPKPKSKNKPKSPKTKLKTKSLKTKSKNKPSKSRPTRLYQRKPIQSKPSLFRPKGWTDTLDGYVAAAKKLARCIVDNRKLMKSSYTWFLTINIEVVHTPEEITKLWSRVCRNMNRKGIVALWVREPTRSGRVHYHFILRNSISDKDLRRIVRESMPDLAKLTPEGTRVGWHMRIQEIDKDWRLARYVTKAKVRGELNDVMVDDVYATKRLLFAANLKLRKYGTIGDFWVKPMKAIWQDVKDTEARIAAGLAQRDVRRLVYHVYYLLDETVPLWQIERGLGGDADSPDIQNWIKSEFYPEEEDVEAQRQDPFDGRVEGAEMEQVEWPSTSTRPATDEAEDDRYPSAPRIHPGRPCPSDHVNPSGRPVASPSLPPSRRPAASASPRSRASQHRH